jgi:hypothetical protein
VDDHFSVGVSSGGVLSRMLQIPHGPAVILPPFEVDGQFRCYLTDPGTIRHLKTRADLLVQADASR